jgi:hypothetical protein
LRKKSCGGHPAISLPLFSLRGNSWNSWRGNLFLDYYRISFPGSESYSGQEKVAQVCHRRGLGGPAPCVARKGFLSVGLPQMTNLRYFSFS